jgi:MFS transporter, DHA2 family, multidrug resistance protein
MAFRDLTTAQTDSSTPASARPAPHKWIIAGTVLTGTIMAVLDSSIVNVALPDMSGTLGVTIQEITWVVTAYILAQVIVMPITGLLASRFGRKRFYMASVLLFTASSMACGLARGLGPMVVVRVLQGFGGGVLLTVSQAILRESFPPEEQGIAMGLYGLGAVLAPAFGPTLGGWITDQYSWPWIFYINVPIGAVNLMLVSRFIEDPPYLIREKGYIDWPGLGLLVMGLGALQLMLEEGERNDWFQSGFILRLTIVAAVGLALFVWRELTPTVALRSTRRHLRKELPCTEPCCSSRSSRQWQCRRFPSPVARHCKDRWPPSFAVVELSTKPLCSTRRRSS